ncbi:hypothetical protein [Quisquiliibacterium transsilvanicum]|uniref:DUF4258 domain-containing protein n=1 Tax=Quisquiliibacterium transsilvanicum TaxID=1549638 RepID=A0A7W8HIA4_9BURK|nr:hypothetical protein [Quisquiliibacterium transsilvanicum]MBB5272540.1 hypothetical protein [Quisquiliibacterium transsilvanicum]
MNMTTHATVRCQQRAIPPILVDLLLQFGSQESAPGNARKVFFDKAARRRVKAYAGPLARALDEHLDVYAIVAGDDTIVTAGHRTEPIRRN